MFRLVKLAPPHGWSAVVWELGIVTLGVLIALGAQQVADDFHWRGEVADFRTAVRAEISGDLATYTYRRDEDRCIAARLNELQRWLDGWRAGRPLKLTGPIGIPASLVIRANVWESRDADTVAHMTLQEKLEYGHLYTEFANNETHRLDERAAWIELADFDGANLLDHHDMMRLQGLITRARLRVFRMNDNARRFMKRAAALGLAPKAPADLPATDPTICRPILGGPAIRA
jgi:ribosome modulation factor